MKKIIATLLGGALLGGAVSAQAVEVAGNVAIGSDYPFRGVSQTDRDPTIQGGFDVAFARDFNDVDFCLRVRDEGHRVAWTPYAHVTHHEGATMSRRKSDPAEAALFRARWADRYPVDPYYSPALNPALARIYEAL